MVKTVKKQLDRIRSIHKKRSTYFITIIIGLILTLAIIEFGKISMRSQDVVEIVRLIVSLLLS